MKKAFLLSLLLLASPAAAAVGIGEKLPAFTATTIDISTDPPKTASLDSQNLAKPTAFFVMGTTCGATAAYVDRAHELETAYAAKGVDFIYVYPNRSDSPEAKTKYHKDHKLGGTLIDDQGGKVAKALGAIRTTELLLVGKDGTLVYHGAIDDNKDSPMAVKNRYAAVALDEHLAGKPVTLAKTDVQA